MNSQEHVVEGSYDVIAQGSYDVGAARCMSVCHHPAMFAGHRHCGSGNISNLSRDLTRPSDFI